MKISYKKFMYIYFWGKLFKKMKKSCGKQTFTGKQLTILQMFHTFPLADKSY
jgi:hypothetical protein